MSIPLFRLGAFPAALLLAALAFLALIQTAAGQGLAPPQSLYGSINDPDGETPEGTKVEAYIGDVECSDGRGTTGFTGVGDDRVAVYVVNVLAREDRPGCGAAGASVRIKIGDEFATQTATWEQGATRVNVSFGNVTPVPLPTNTPAPATNTPNANTPTAGPTEEPTTTTGPGTPTSTPRGGLSGATPGGNGGGESGDDDGDGFPLWGVVVIALAVIAAAGGTVGYVVSRNNRDDPEDTF
ncbi:MAG TPA: hypothetical protein VFK32_01070 [Tepidiformaceae bacterium]|nr:hypothetical protein [Tepidiformaceae bacterium]